MPSTARIMHLLLPLGVFFTTTSALNTMDYLGCFSSSTGLTEVATFQYQSSGHCQEVCVGDGNQAVLGLTNGNDCWCGSQTPPTSDKVDDSNCDSPCTGYGQDDCGGDSYWSVYTTGTTSSVGSVGGSGSSASGSSAASSASTSISQALPASSTDTPTTTSAAPSVVTSIAPGKTVIVTESPSSADVSASSSAQATGVHKSKGPNIGGIVAGAVVGVVVIAILIGALFFFLRNRRRRQAEADAAGWTPSGKPQIPATRKPSGPDARIDPEAMAQHRMSDGSIADNADYSRRILQVTNPDDR